MPGNGTVTIDREVFDSLLSAAARLHGIATKALVASAAGHSYFKFETDAGKEYVEALERVLELAEEQAGDEE